MNTTTAPAPETCFEDKKNVIYYPEIKTSFFLLKNSNSIEGDKLMVRCEEGRMKGIICEIYNFKISDLRTNLLTFDYDVVYNPYKKIPNKKSLTMFIKNTVRYIVTTAFECVKNNEDKVKNDNTTPNSKISTK